MKTSVKSTNNAKLKALNPTLRIKTRYLVYEVLNPKKDLNIVKSIESQCKELYGIIGFAELDFRKIEEKGNKGIIMINRKSVDKLKASFVFLNKKENIGIVSRYVSGSLKKAKTFL